MRIDVKNDTLNDIEVIHGKEVLHFSAGPLDHKNVERSRIFHEINAFWASLDQARQKEIFEVYRQIEETFDTVFELKKLHTRLTRLSTELLNLHPLEDIAFWVKAKTDIRPPSSMKLDYGPNDTRDMTYLRDDYEEITVLSIALRPMVPIWGQYIEKNNREVGTNYKEYMALGLISRSRLIRSSAIRRLELYIEASVRSDSATLASVIGGLGSTELPGWLMAQTLVRRISVVDITNSDDRNNLISNLYRSVRGAVDALNRKFKGAVRDKRPEGSDNEEDNSSIAENYKVKQVISDGDLVVLSYFTEKLDAVAKRIDPEIPLELVKDCYQALKQDSNFTIQQPTLVLTQWVIRDALPPRSIPSMNKPALLRAMAVCQAALMHWGYPYLAALIGATPSRTDDGDFLGIMESRSRIPKEMVAKLIELYPHYQAEGRQATDKQLNPACRAVELLTKELIHSDWVVRGPKELLTTIEAPRNKVILVPADIRAQLASLVIQLATPKESAETANTQVN